MSSALFAAMLDEDVHDRRVGQRGCVPELIVAHGNLPQQSPHDLARPARFHTNGSDAGSKRNGTVLMTWNLLRTLVKI